LIKVVGLGAGGHAKVLIETLRYDTTYELVGLLDKNALLHGGRVLGVPVLGSDDLLSELAKQGVQHFFVGVGSVGKATTRQSLFECGVRHGLIPLTTLHPSAAISPSAKLGKGVAILAGAVVNAETSLGDNVTINTGAIIEHDCSIGDHVHVATGARVTSSVQIGEGAHIGAGATIRQCIKIGAGAIVGAGAVVVRDVPAHVVVVGIPARPLVQKRLDEQLGRETRPD
jgi:UDP-perosamine 4-acetyltransferase